MKGSRRDSFSSADRRFATWERHREYEQQREREEEILRRDKERERVWKQQEAEQQFKTIAPYLAHAWLGAVVRRDAKDVKTLYSLFSQSKSRSLSEKQLALLKVLYRRNVRSSPIKRKEFTVEQSGIPVSGLRPDEADRLRELNVSFYGNAFHFWEDLPKPPEKPVEEPPAPSAGDLAARLAALDELLAKRDDRFLRSLRDQLAAGRSLSENQLKALRHNFYRAGMRQHADLFR